MTHSYAITVIVLLFLLTVATRSLPFIFGKKMGENGLIIFLGKQLPTCIILLLAIYYIISMAKPSHWHNLPWQMISIVITLLVQWRWRNVALSIFIGTGLYLLLDYFF